MKKKYNFKMRMNLVLSCLMIFAVFGANAQTITLNAVLSGKTTSADVSTNGDVTNFCSTCDRGYVKFDLSSIPGGVTITSATLNLVAIAPSTTSATSNKITSTTLDAATAGAGFYAALNSSTTAAITSFSFSSLPSAFPIPINAAGISNLNTALGTGQITYGLVRGSTPVYTFAGYNNATVANRPQLVINYALPCTGTPVAGTASAPATTCGATNFNLSLAGYSTDPGITFQWQSSPDGITPYVNIPGATAAVSPVSQTATTFYQCIVTCTGSGMSDTSNVITVGMSPFFSCYCSSAATNPYDEEIGNVTLGALNNTSTCSTTGGVGSTLSLYSNYTGLTPVGFQRTLIVPFSLESITCGGNYNNGFAVYIDFDQNGSFADPGEEVYTSPGLTNGPHIETGTITIPLTAALGVTGMRVMNVEGGFYTPCGTYGYGETEDYSIEILAAPSCIQPNTLTASGATTSSATLGWTAGATETNWDVYYGLAPLAAPTGATIPTASTTTNSYTATGLTSLTAYQYYVRADCGAGSTSAWTGPYNFNTICGGTTCDYVFVLSDLYGGWEGASIDIKQNGVLIQTVTQPGFALTDSINVPLCDGVTTTLSWNRGSYPWECSFQLYNPFNVSMAQFSDGSLLAEDSVFATFTTNCTPPACPQPYGVTVTNVGTDSAIISWSCPTCTGPYIIEYDTTGFAPGSGTADTVASSPYTITGLNQATGYQVYVSQDCSGTGDGESTLAGPSSFTTTVTYDNVCGALPLTMGSNGPFQTSVGTIQAGEPAPPADGCQVQTGWCNSDITNTLWFTFVAPASGRVQIQSPGFDTQLAVWEALTCDTILNGGATLVAANDDDADYSLHGGAMYSSYVNPVSCLTPGATYYVQLDAYSPPGGSTTIILTDIGPADASFITIDSTYCTVDPTVTLVPAETGGVFSGPGVSGTTFDPALAGIGTHVITYKLSACDSTSQTVVVDSIPVASYTYFNVVNVITFTNTSTGGSTYSWNFGDGSPTSSVTNPVHTFAANGAYTVQLIVTSGCGVDTVAYTLVITGVGIDEITEGSVSIYPNPTNGVFNVTVNNASFSELKISIVDIQGKEVFSSLEKNVKSAYNKQINLEGLSKGMYYIKLNTGSDEKIQKLIIQ